MSENKYQIVDGTAYPVGANGAVIRILEDARKRNTRITLSYGDTKTGRDWLEEFSVTGTVGRSTGMYKIPILLYNERSNAGGGILVDSVVRIRTALGKRVLYQHPKYHHASLKIGKPWKGIRVGVYADRKPQAGFGTKAAAERYIAFFG